MKLITKLVKTGLILGFLMLVLGGVGFGVIAFLIVPELPSVQSLRDVQLQEPLRIYSREGALLAEFGEKKRKPVTVQELPAELVQAFLAAEDDRFFEHPGVDYQGLLRAAFQLALSGEKKQGGSTITMQVARNFFLTREKTYLRKVKEIFLALKIEREISKHEILALYLNKIFLGYRSYGVAAAAQTYYGVGPQGLTLAQMAMIAGLPKAPSRYNPIINSARAKLRRDYVLRRMRELNVITPERYEAAVQEPVSAKRHSAALDMQAPFVAEMVRAEMLQRFGSDAYNLGYKVYTTIVKDLQEAANDAVVDGVMAYDRRHGYRGVQASKADSMGADSESWDELLSAYSSVATLVPALVVAVEEKVATVYHSGEQFSLGLDTMTWARSHISVDRRGPTPQSIIDIMKKGDVIWVESLEDGWQLAQLPNVEALLVGLSPENGAITALTGGYDFYRSKFNRATSARRQPGSGFKPFIYSAALEEGYTAASLINDAPVVFDDPGLESAWRPENYSGKFYGPTRMRVALMKSRNLVSIRLLRAVGIRKALDFIERFGFDKARLPHDLSLALGSGAVTPLDIARGYASFANGGYAVKPYFIDRIEDAHGEILFQHNPEIVCPNCNDLQETPLQDGAEQPLPTLYAKRIVPEETIYLINSLMRDVIRRGTGRKARALGRSDLAGKTGTTNDQRDAWFSGFHATQVAIAWLGSDGYGMLGGHETGGKAALPIWMDYMAKALEGIPEYPLREPEGIVTVRIDPKTGLRVAPDFPGAIFEVFRAENVPERLEDASEDVAQDVYEEGESLF